MTRHILVNGEVIGRREYGKIMDMLIHDCKEMAGVYHGEKRSEKFRVNWPDVDAFVAANWKTFVVAVRAWYAERLGDPKTPPEDARRMHLAIVLQQMAEEGLKRQGLEADMRLQLAPGTQQFEGDVVENRKILENFGRKPNLRALLMGGGAADLKIPLRTWR